MREWEFSESRPTGGGDSDCGCACCHATDWRPEHEPECPIGQAARENATLLAVVEAADRLEHVFGQRDSRNLYPEERDALSAYRAKRREVEL